MGSGSPHERANNMAKKSVTLAGLIRRVNKELIGRGDAIEIIMEARPNWTYDRLARDPHGLLRDEDPCWSHRCFPLLIERPGSGELVEINFPCESRVVPKRLLVRPVIPFCSSLTTLDESLYPVVTDPMILRLPSRT